MPKSASGDEVIKLLSKNYGFIFVSQKGSHVKLKKQLTDRTIVTIVPRHRELAIGTLRGVLELALIDFKEFQDLL
jgi:predicted RNA binding protein YcfA (HicA-like mRNA interferase family)